MQKHHSKHNTCARNAINVLPMEPMFPYGNKMALNSSQYSICTKSDVFKGPICSVTLSHVDASTHGES